MQDLGVLSSGTYSCAYSINASGYIAGISDQLSYSYHHKHLFEYYTSMSDLELNNSIANYPTGCDSAQLPSQYAATDQAFLGINSSNVIVGGHDFEQHGAAAYITPYHAYIYTSGTIDDLGTMYPTYSEARSIAHSINNNGKFVGFSDVSPVVNCFFDTHAFLSSGTGCLSTSATDLGVLSGGSYSEAFCVNNSPQVVGTSNGSSFSGFHACYWPGTASATDLNNSVTSAAGWTLTYALGINNPTAPATVGSIVGYGTQTISGTGYTRAYLYSF